jgi:hypothetical protein
VYLLILSYEDEVREPVELRRTVLKLPAWIYCLPLSNCQPKCQSGDMHLIQQLDDFGRDISSAGVDTAKGRLNQVTVVATVVVRD